MSQKGPQTEKITAFPLLSGARKPALLTEDGDAVNIDWGPDGEVLIELNPPAD